MKPNKIRFLLTSACSASCAYPHLKLITNHPLFNVQNSVNFVSHARNLEVRCKIIETFQFGIASCVNWGTLDYTQQSAKVWLHQDGNHQLFTKQCGAKHNPVNSFFIGADGVRLELDCSAIGLPEAFDVN